MMHDKFGNRVITDQPATVAAIDHYTDEFLSYGPGLPVIIAAADADPESPTANVHAAAVHLAAESAEGARRAAQYLARAEAGAGRCDERERMLIRAVRAWADGDYRQAAALYLRMTRRWPNDIVTAKWGQYHCFNLGDREGILRFAQTILPAHRGTPYMHGMLAFGLEQCGRLGEAEDAARQAVEIEQGDAWAHHALAHVMDTEGRVGEGHAFLCSVSGTWTDKGKFIRHHNWWHVGLFCIDLRDHAGALDVFDRHIWGLHPEFGQEQIGAVSTLWRLDIRGVDVGGRWAAIAEKVRARGCEHIQPFLDVHYVYALIRGGHDAAASRFIASLEVHAERSAPAMRPIWSRVAVPVAHGVAAYARARHDEAYHLLRPVMPRLHLLGGSHAQRDVLHQTWLDILFTTRRFMGAVGTLAHGYQPMNLAAGGRRRLARALDLWRRPAPAVDVRNAG